MNALDRKKTAAVLKHATFVLLAFGLNNHYYIDL